MQLPGHLASVAWVALRSFVGTLLVLSLFGVVLAGASYCFPHCRKRAIDFSSTFSFGWTAPMKTAVMVLACGVVGFFAGLFLVDFVFRSAGPFFGFISMVGIPLAAGAGVAVGFSIARRWWW